MKNSTNLAVLILAAGRSSRLGQPKQLVKYKSKTLLEHSCENALKVSKDVFVVLGEKYDECKNKLENIDVNIIYNEEYKKGLSTSIKSGIKQLEAYDKVLIMLCDQPFIPLSHFQNLVKEEIKHNKIIASLYENNLSVPAIFPKRFYSQLLSLSGDKGAKAVILNNEYKHIILENNLSIDIDTKEDLATLKEAL